MAQICRLPSTPKQALRKAGPLDRALNVELFKALGDPARARLLACLSKCARSCSVSEAAQCCDIDFSVVSRHLSLLARAGVLTARKKGRVVYYKVRFPELVAALRELADALEACGAEDRERKDGGCC